MCSIECIQSESIARLSEILEKGGKISVLAHTHPDGDALGSVGALVSYLKDIKGLDAMAVFSDAAPDSLSFLCTKDEFIFADTQSEAALERIYSSDTIFLLDASEFSRTEQLSDQDADSTSERDKYDIQKITKGIGNIQSGDKMNAACRVCLRQRGDAGSPKAFVAEDRDALFLSQYNRFFRHRR